MFEGSWSCSDVCMQAILQSAVAREMGAAGNLGSRYRPRIPLGLLMLQQGWISVDQLKSALEEQKAHGSGRLGEWLIRQRAATEEMITKALSLQWNCPVLKPDTLGYGAASVAMPRLFLDAFGALPLRLAAGRVLYLGFEERLDPILAFALERMSGIETACGIVPTLAFREAQHRLLSSLFPSSELVEATSASAAAHALCQAVERHRPRASRLVRVHDLLWLRIWLRESRGSLSEPNTIHDVLCSIGPIR